MLADCVKFLLLFFLGASLSACSTSYAEYNSSSSSRAHNVNYGVHKKQKLDVYKPLLADTAIPIVVLIHGGSWKKGDKLMLRSVQKMLLRNNVSSININYRLVGRKTSLTQQMQDIETALKKADTLFYAGKPGNYVFLGESAGAHLAMLYAYKNTARVNKIISLSGPTDLTDKAYLQSFKSVRAIPIFNKLTESKFKKGTEVPTAFIEASPLFTAANVPTLLVQGGRDLYVNKRQAFKLDSTLNRLQVPHRLVYIKNGGHVSRLNPWYRKKIIYPAIKEWIGVQEEAN